jgi:hypothetical protein
MEHGKILDDIHKRQVFNEADSNLKRFVLYDYTLESPLADCEKFLFSDENLTRMQDKLTYLLRGVHPEGKKIVVNKEVIANTLSGYFIRQVPQVGDIFSRYQVVNELVRNDAQELINKTLQTIYDYIKNEYEMIENNNKLTIWTTVYGDFNEHGLRRHSTIKINHKRPDPMLFNMNY